MKIITVCGSLKYKDEIMKATEEYALKGNCMLSIVYPTKENIDDYIGESTKNEIEFAQSLNKEIIYYRKQFKK